LVATWRGGTTHAGLDALQALRLQQLGKLRAQLLLQGRGDQWLFVRQELPLVGGALWGAGRPGRQRPCGRGLHDKPAVPADVGLHAKAHE
jgi:hypothetical protein